MIHIANNTPDPVYFEGTYIAPGCFYIINPNPDMNAEQLARDIASLDQAHRELDQVVKEPGASVGFKAHSLAASYEALKAQQPVDDFSSKVRSEIRSEISSSLGKSCLEVRSLTTQNLVHMLIDRLRALKAEQGNNISVECAQQTHKELSRAGIAPYAKLDLRVKELVDELLKRREDPALKEIREIVSKALGYSHEAISGTTTAGLVEMLARGCKDMRDHGFLEKLHREFDRAEPRYLGGVIERARRAVDELLKLRQQGEGNSSNLTEKDRHEIREKMFKALGKAEDPGLPTAALVETLIQKHQQLHDNFKLLQHFSSGQPKGLAPKEKWKALEVLGSVDLFSVVRGFECATPHPVSKGIADAIAGELNAR